MRAVAQRALAQLNEELEHRRGGTKHVILQGAVLPMAPTILGTG